MAIIAGIDEAGFGPLLGPLVVSAVVFRVPDDRIDRCLWQTLQASCAKTVQRGSHRLVIADSKVLFRARKNLAAVERAVLVTLATAGKTPPTWRALLDTVAPHAAEHLDSYPWYAGRDVPLPISDGVGDVAIQANAVRRDLTHNGVEMIEALVEPLTVSVYNRLVANTRNKSVVLLGLVLRLIDRIMHVAGEQRLRLFVDRLGGRMRYRDAIMTALEGGSLQILEESSRRSAYRITRRAQTCEIEFVIRGDSKHFPIALASLYSKYVRELYMHVFNNHWQGQCPNVTPTAGYYADAQRWLAETGPELTRQGVNRSLLVRTR